MKMLYLIGGTMGVGKTTVCRELNARLPNSVFLDGDWCWCMDPFRVNNETKAMVMDNICHLLNNFLKCSAIQNIVFCWVMHEQGILDELLSRLELGDCHVAAYSLICTREALRSRLQRDIDCRLRGADVLGRSLSRLPLYDALDTVKVDTTDQTPAQIADKLLAVWNHRQFQRRNPDMAPKELVTRFFLEGYANQNYDFVMDCMAEDYIDHSPAGARSNADAVGILKIVAGQFSNLRVEMLDIFAEESMVATRVLYDGIHAGECMGIPATGRRIRFEALENFKVQDGKIVESWGYWPDEEIRRKLTQE